MIYYTSDLRKMEYTPDEQFKIGEGTQGTVYKQGNNQCIKIYNGERTTFDPEIFELFQALVLPNYGKLYDLLYGDSGLQEVAAYTMEYYQSSAENILHMPTEYTLENFNILFNSIKSLADNRVLAKDLIPVNAILGKDNITIIDFDSCVRAQLDSEAVLEVNINNLLYLFKRLYRQELMKLGKDVDNNKVLSSYLNYLFSYSSEPVKTLKRKLEYTKTPMDSLYWRC